MSFEKLLIPLLLFLASCGHAEVEPKSTLDRDSRTTHSIKYLDTERTFARISLPASWQLHPNVPFGSAAIIGFDGLEVKILASETYAYSTDTAEQRYINQQGVKSRPPPGIEALLALEILPEANKKGLIMSERFDVPAIAENLTDYSRAFVNGKDSKYWAKAIEYFGKKGFRHLYIITYYELPSGKWTTWSYELKELKAPMNDFDWAVEKYIAALSTATYNPNLINEANRQVMGEVGGPVDSWIEDEKLLGLKGEALKKEKQRQAVRIYQFYEYSQRDTTWD